MPVKKLHRYFLLFFGIFLALLLFLSQKGTLTGNVTFVLDEGVTADQIATISAIATSGTQTKMLSEVSLEQGGYVIFTNLDENSDTAYIEEKNGNTYVSGNVKDAVTVMQKEDYASLLEQYGEIKIINGEIVLPETETVDDEDEAQEIMEEVREETKEATEETETEEDVEEKEEEIKEEEEAEETEEKLVVDYKDSWCEDTDGGEVYDVGGTVTGMSGYQKKSFEEKDYCVLMKENRGYHVDECSGENCFLGEFFCNVRTFYSSLDIDGDGKKDDATSWDRTEKYVTCPEGGCRNGACASVEIQSSCTDTEDDLADLYIAGVVTYIDEKKKETVLYDSCYKGTSVTDYYCVGETGYLSQTTPCPYECEKGACVKPETCNAETDAGNDPLVSGSVTTTTNVGTTKTLSDYCENGKIMEWDCSTGKPIIQEHVCDMGSTCVDGICVQAYCKETDEGDDMYTKGSIEGVSSVRKSKYSDEEDCYFGDDRKRTRIESCSGEGCYLNENSCYERTFYSYLDKDGDGRKEDYKEQDYQSKYSLCSQGCEKGACLPEEGVIEEEEEAITLDAFMEMAIQSPDDVVVVIGEHAPTGQLIGALHLAGKYGFRVVKDSAVNELSSVHAIALGSASLNSVSASVLEKGAIASDEGVYFIYQNAEADSAVLVIAGETSKETRKAVRELLKY